MAAVYTRLEPTIPMRCPKGKGRAVFLIDYGEDHHLEWVIAIDATGECWTYPNPLIRFRANVTLGTREVYPPEWDNPSGSSAVHPERPERDQQ